MRIETKDGVFEFDPSKMDELYQVRGDLAGPMTQKAAGVWEVDIPLGCRYKLEKLVLRHHVSYVLYRLCDGYKDLFMGDVTV